VQRVVLHGQQIADAELAVSIEVRRPLVLHATLDNKCAQGYYEAPDRKQCERVVAEVLSSHSGNVPHDRGATRPAGRVRGAPALACLKDSSFDEPFTSGLPKQQLPKEGFARLGRFCPLPTRHEVPRSRRFAVTEGPLPCRIHEGSGVHPGPSGHRPGSPDPFDGSADNCETRRLGAC
jgi:hypothetical protein